MGYRIVAIDMPVEPACHVVTLLRQIAAFARFEGVDVFLKEPEQYPGVWDLIIEANSSYLNEFTPKIINMAVRIAADIDADGGDLKSLVTSIASQLNEQIVDWSGVPTLTSARPGRELAERLTGESSFRQLRDELRIHATRIRKQVTQYHGVSGPTAWRRRHELSLMLRIDGIALIATARRLRRIASEVRRTLPGSHLDKAINRFDQKTPGLITLRDIAEHIDEYSIGHGKKDAGHPEPGEVFALAIQDDDIIISARSHALGILAIHAECLSLIRCLMNTSDCHAFVHLMPMIADFDFMTYNGEHFQPVARSEESVEQAKQREVTTELMGPVLGKLKLPAKRCSECNDWI